MSTQAMDTKTAGEDLARAAAAPPAVTGDEYATVPLTALVPSPLNPRKHFDDVELAEMAVSMRALGVLEPLLVRANRAASKRIDPRFEIVAGERRFRAAKIAGLAAVPVRIVHLTDKETLEVMVVENLQRAGLTALEESSGYRQLHKDHGFTVEQIAEKVGKSKAYVYARLKLADLTKEAAALVADGTLSPAHAILLARLSPADQKRAIDMKGHDSGVFERRYDGGAEPTLAVKSVRDLDAWIDETVRLDPKKDADQLQPEAAATLADARTVVLITRKHWIAPGEKGGATAVLESDWKRADGQEKSLVCDKAVTGFVSVGPGRGDAFNVCVDKRGCKVHWPPEPKRRGLSAGPSSEDSMAAYNRDEAKRRAKEKEKQERWSQTMPAILDATAARVKKLAAGAEGPLGKFLFAVLPQGDFYLEADTLAQAAKLVPRGKTAEDLVRHLAFALMCADAREEYSSADFMKRAKGLGVDVEKIVAAAAPAAAAKKGATPKKAKRG